MYCMYLTCVFHRFHIVQPCQKTHPAWCRGGHWERALHLLEDARYNQQHFFGVETRPGKRTNNHGKSPFFMGKLTISMAIFNSYVSHYQLFLGPFSIIFCNKLPEGIGFESSAMHGQWFIQNPKFSKSSLSDQWFLLSEPFLNFLKWQ